MGESILSKIQVCAHCRKAYIPNVEGDHEFCDECLDDPFIPEESVVHGNELDDEEDDE